MPDWSWLNACTINLEEERKKKNHFYSRSNFFFYFEFSFSHFSNHAILTSFIQLLFSFTKISFLFFTTFSSSIPSFHSEWVIFFTILFNISKYIFLNTHFFIFFANKISSLFLKRNKIENPFFIYIFWKFKFQSSKNHFWILIMS